MLLSRYWRIPHDCSCKHRNSGLCLLNRHRPGCNTGLRSRDKCTVDAHICSVYSRLPCFSSISKMSLVSMRMESEQLPAEKLFQTDSFWAVACHIPVDALGRWSRSMVLSVLLILVVTSFGREYYARLFKGNDSKPVF